MIRLRQCLAIVLVWGIVLSTSPASAATPEPLPQEAPPAPLTASQIDPLVAPIALYPDALVAQVLAAATYPNEVADADQWLQANSNLQGTALVDAVNQQPWDPSVQALTQFPSVLDNMANNLSWTSALGEAFYNQQADVMAAVQRLRQQAYAAGNLKSTSQVTVVQQAPQTIVIEPANPQVVYVPVYNPTVVYGTPYYPPGYSTGALVATSLISFGVGIAVGAAMSSHCCAWGWNNWNCGWRGGTVVYNRNTYVSRSNVFVNNNRYNNNNRPRPTPYGSNNYNRTGNRNTNVSGNTVNINNGGNRSTNVNNRPNYNVPNNPGNVYRPNQGAINQNNGRPQNTARPSNSQYRGYGQTPSPGTKTGAFSGYGAGGSTRTEAQRGRSSVGSGEGRSAGGGGRRGR
jgi:uncharacterized membrane protein YgcG